MIFATALLIDTEKMHAAQINRRGVNMTMTTEEIKKNAEGTPESYEYKRYKLLKKIKETSPLLDDDELGEEQLDELRREQLNLSTIRIEENAVFNALVDMGILDLLEATNAVENARRKFGITNTLESTCGWELVEKENE